MKGRLHFSGFSLVELIVTVAVLAVLITLAIPSFVDLIDRNRIKRQTMAVVDVLEFARMEALKRSKTTSGSTDVNVVFAKTDNQSWTVVGTHDTEARKVASSEVQGVALIDGPVPNSPVTLTYDFRGIVTGAVDTDFTLQSPKGKQLKLRVNAIGRVNVCSPSGSVWGFASC